MIFTLSIVTACGGSGDSESPPPSQPTEPSAAVEAETAASLTSEFETAVRAARDEAQRMIDEANRELELAGQGLGMEAFLMGPLAENLGEMVTVLNEYVEQLRELEVPAEYREDVSRQVARLDELIDLTEEEQTAAAAGDDARASELVEQRAELLALLASDLSPEYAELAFVTPIEGEFVSLFGELSEQELAYLDGVRAAENQFARRNADFGRALRGQYASPEALLKALYDAGAGEAFAAVRDVALTLEPPPSFERDHERWLSQLDELVRTDELIGKAARDGDMSGFLANNVRLALVGLPDAADVTPSFAAALQPGSPLAAELDPQTPVAQTAYGHDLFGALKEFAMVDPSDALIPLFELPAPDETKAASIRETGEELIAVSEEERSSMVGLEPPEEYETDHETIIGYLDDFLAQIEALVAAARADDFASARVEWDRITDIYCTATASLSESILPAADIYFDPNDPDCAG